MSSRGRTSSNSHGAEDGSEYEEFTRMSDSFHVVRVLCVSSWLHEMTKKVRPLKMTSKYKPLEVTSKDNDSFTQIKLSDLSINFTDSIDHGSFGDVFKGTCKCTAVPVTRIKLKRGKRQDRLIMEEAITTWET